MKDLETLLTKYPWLALVVLAGVGAYAYYRKSHPDAPKPPAPPTPVTPPPADPVPQPQQGDSYATTSELIALRQEMQERFDALNDPTRAASPIQEGDILGASSGYE